METNFVNPFEVIDNRLKNIESMLIKLNQKVDSNIQTESAKPALQTNFIDLDDFAVLHPKKLSKSTLYTQISLKKIPSELVYKPLGSKKLLFYKDKVLEWIKNGMGSQAEQVADEYMSKLK